LAGFAGDKENGVFRRGADVVANFATGAEIRVHAGFALLDRDGSTRRASLGTDGTKRSLIGEAKAVENEGERRYFVCRRNLTDRFLHQRFHVLRTAAEHGAE
jgi:hypothetical protein